MSNLVLEQYETGKLNLKGTLGNLTSEETALLQKLWRRLFGSFEKPTHGISATTAPSPAPSVKRSSRPRADASSRAATPQPEPSASTYSGLSGWFGLSSKSKSEVELADSNPTPYNEIVGQVADESSLPPTFAAESRPTTIRDAFWAAVQGDHPDVLLLRFLRARKWKVDDALDMLLACLRWRLDEEIDWLVWVGESELNYALMQSGIGAIHKMDRLGQPILYIPVRLNDPRAQPADQMVEYTIYLMEVSRILLHPPVEKVCLVFDTTDMSISNMDWTFFKTFLHYLEHYYPECLGLVLIYNASWVFNSLWKLIRPLLDPVVASKVQFVNSAAELQKFIDPENLPVEYGGNDAFKYKYVLPQPDENKAMFDEDGRKHAAEARSEACNEFEAVTRRWVGIDSAAEDLAKDLDNSSRQKAADALVEASKGLDKYVRARTLYHRTRAIDDKGRFHGN
ncbi:hypothetical protein GGI25_004478 [Coemansia spiralis]|uniref:CRAL-TRIO domain-containing protein n=2 Tax=Coemansia TaxID=4863 RepID=A0A9W8G614_9FUNG|nr:hypothetical protein EDC05_005246 [Coemansia umbellata]KAJ2619838.1 hypothetical protein GGI26_005512 [Coemansia sp. RSA 1358]KAJ2673993.1 hypothetical protein GGI25_004478 [Coemansia spiralis]